MVVAKANGYVYFVTAKLYHEKDRTRFMPALTFHWL